MWNYVSFEGGNALKHRELITRDTEGRIIPPSERFDDKNRNWNFSRKENRPVDKPLTSEEIKNIKKFKVHIRKDESSYLDDISENEAYKQSGLNCDKIIVNKSVMNEAQRLGIDTDKIPYELLRPTAIISPNRHIKQTRILTTLGGKQDRIVCFQGTVNNDNFVVLDDILGYREEKLDEILENALFINKEKARLLRERRLQSGASVQLNEPSDSAFSIYSSPSQAKFSGKLENVMDAADKKFENKKDKVVSSLRDMGVEVTEHKRRDNESQYIDVHLDNGSTIYVRVSDHPARTRIDVSIEKDWKAGTRFIYEQVKQNNWATAENPYWQGDAKLRFSRKENTETEENKNGQDWLLDKNGNRVKDNRPVKPIVEESTKAVILDTAEKIPTRKDSILKYLKDYLVGKGLFINTPFGKFNVLFRYDGLKHDVWSQRISQKKAQTFTMLPELVQNARYFGEDSVKHDKNNLKTENLYHLISLVKNGNKYDIVRIVLKGTKKGKYVYNHSVYEGSSTEGAVLSRIKAIASQIHVELLNKDSQNISESQADTANFNFSRPENQSAQEKRDYQQKKAREEITSKSGRIIQATTDAFAPLAALERVIYGKIRGAEKSAWKMALMTKNLDQVMFHLLRVGAIKYNKADGSFTTREGTKGLEEILNPIKGKAYKNFENFAKAKSAFERWAHSQKKKSFSIKKACF